MHLCIASSAITSVCTGDIPRLIARAVRVSGPAIPWSLPPTTLWCCLGPLSRDVVLILNEVLEQAV